MLVLTACSSLAEPPCARALVAWWQRMARRRCRHRAALDRVAHKQAADGNAKGAGERLLERQLGQLHPVGPHAMRVGAWPVSRRASPRRDGKERRGEHASRMQWMLKCWVQCTHGFALPSSSFPLMPSIERRPRRRPFLLWRPRRRLLSEPFGRFLLPLSTPSSSPRLRPSS